jgi:RNA polymerase II C-terminal domain phosphatase-like 1/2
MLHNPDNSHATDDGTKCPVFWGYMMYFGVASAVSVMLENSRMAVVLDLDETLLVANSMSTLDSKIEVARKTR